jgi:hypothetical protein
VPRADSLRGKSLGLLASAVAAVVAVFFVPPVPQSQSYHAFADARTLLGIPNAHNVLSNVGFFIVGFLGLVVIVRPGGCERERQRKQGAFAHPGERLILAVLFAGVVATGAGSTYYHLAPSSARLVWDRLPITIVFMSLFSIALVERISWKVGSRLFVPLVLGGVASVFYWQFCDDLRIYGLVQFYPMAALPFLLWLFPPTYTRTSDWVGMLACYALAKVFELLDAPIYSSLHIVSGHALKHVAGAIALYWLVRSVRLRRLAIGQRQLAETAQDGVK